MDQSIQNQLHKRRALLWLLFAVFCMSGMARSVTTYSGFTQTAGSYTKLAYLNATCDKFVDGDFSTSWYRAVGSESVPAGETEAGDNALTLFDDTETLDYSPVDGWSSAYLPKNQFIIPSSLLSSVPTGSYISQLVFYSVNDAVDLGTARYEVYLDEPEQNCFYHGDDFVAWSSLSSVYDGSLSISGHTMSVVFDHPYQYQGGNLLIGFNQIEPGSNIKTEWYGKSFSVHVGSGNWAYYVFYVSIPTSNSLPSGGLKLPKTTIIYSSTLPSVIRPTGLTSSLTQGDGSVATLSWTENGSAVAWEICLNDDETNLISATSNPFTLSGLIPETAYSVKVRSVNGDERSLWSESVAFRPTDNYTVTLNNGTDTNEYVPIHNRDEYYTDNFLSKGQFIIPSEALSSLTDSYINRLTFYAEDFSYNFGTAEFDVQLSTATRAVFLIDPSTGNPIVKDWDDSSWVTVYSGRLSVSDHIMEIDFAIPYHYEGGNLQIGINQTQTADGVDCNWYGTNQTENTSVGGVVTWGGSPNMKCEQFLPKTTIGYTLDDPRAIKVPKNLSVSYEGGTSAEVSWTSTESGWDLKLKNVLTEDSVVVENVTSPYTLTNLSLGTKYEVCVRSRRDNVSVVGTIFSEWTEAETFITDLAPDGDWCQIGLYLSDASGDGWTGNAIRVEDVLTGKELATVANSSESGAGEEQLISVDVPVGRKIQLVWVQGENPSDCSWRVVDVNREDICTSTDVDVASLSDGDVLAVYTVDCTISPWKKPTGLTVRPLVSLATVDWQENSDPAATSWILAYKSASDTDFTELSVSEHPYVMESLAPETTYILKVRPDTGAGGVEKWSEEVEFTMNADYVAPYDLSATIDATQSTASLSWSGNSSQYNVKYRKKASFFEDFESGIPSSWSCVDADGDGHGWDVFTYTTGPSEVPVDGLVEGGKYPSSASYDIDNNQSLSPDNWLITPRIPLRGTLKVGLRGYTADFSPENYAIYLSTTGTSVSDFTTQLVGKTGATSSFVEQSIDLSLYEGQTGYIAIRHFDTEDKLRLLVDDFGLYESADWTSMTVDDPSTVIEGLDANSLYEFQVQGLNPDLAGGTAWSSIYSFFTYTGSFTQKGDVNRDGTLNVEDVTALVNIIQHRDKAEYNYDYDAADLNGDGEYNVIDVTSLINLIQGR